MKNTDFMKALGRVDARYVEETLDARESAGRRILRWNPLPAIGVLSGAAVCAAMVLTIMAVKNPSGESVKTPNVATSDVAMELTEESHALPFSYSISQSDITASGVLVKIMDGDRGYDGSEYPVEWCLEDGDGNALTPYKSLTVQFAPKSDMEYQFDWSDSLTLTKTAKYYLRIRSVQNPALFTVLDLRFVGDDMPNGFDFYVAEDSVIAYSLDVDIHPWVSKEETYELKWVLVSGAGEPISPIKSVTVDGSAEQQSFTLEWASPTLPYETYSTNYGIRFFTGDFANPEYDFGTASFTYGTAITDANSNPFKSLKMYDMIIPEESVTKNGLKLNITLPEKTDEAYLVQWSLNTHSGLNADENKFLTRFYSLDSQIVIPAGSVGTQTVDISWSDHKNSTHPTKIEPGSYELFVIMISKNGVISYGNIQFNFGVDEPIVSTTQEPAATTTTTDTGLVIHFPNDPYSESTTTTAAVTAPAEYNDGKVRVIAEFREQMGKEPAVLSEEEGTNITKLIDALQLVPSTKSYGDAYVGELTGGCYLIYANGKRYQIWDETVLRLDGQYYIMCRDGDTKGGKALLDAVIDMVTKYQP